MEPAATSPLSSALSSARVELLDRYREIQEDDRDDERLDELARQASFETYNDPDDARMTVPGREVTLGHQDAVISDVEQSREDVLHEPGPTLAELRADALERARALAEEALLDAQRFANQEPAPPDQMAAPSPTFSDVTRGPPPVPSDESALEMAVRTARQSMIVGPTVAVTRKRILGLMI